MPRRKRAKPTPRKAEPLRAPVIEFSDGSSKEILRRLSKSVISSNSLPHGNTRTVGELTSPSLAGALNAMCVRTKAMLDSALVQGLPQSKDLSLPEAYVEALDSALELSHTALDDAEELRGSLISGAALSAASPRPDEPLERKKKGKMENLRKPQLDFPDYPIDNSEKPFIPPHSTSAAASDSSPASGERHLEKLLQNNAPDVKNVQHPYLDEIKEAIDENNRRIPLFDPEDITVFEPLEKTPFTYVDTEKKLLNMTERLKIAAIIAVDLENHSVHSFLGFTCLIQISTRKEDFVIDTIKLRGVMHRALAPIFTDPTVIKVFHGAESDIEWLERDFGIYVVNMFDTCRAATALNYPLKSLSHLLSKFCDVKCTDKKRYQRSDWRKRPLPKGMLNYARSDTHYLLYIYDRLREELAKKQKLAVVHEQSGNVCQRRFTKPVFKASLGRTLMSKHGLGFDGHQKRVLDELLRWRDMTARDVDESWPIIASNKLLFAIVRARDVARTPMGISEVMAQNKQISKFMSERADVLSRLISDALDAPVCEAPTESQEPTPSESRRAKRRQRNGGRRKITSHAMSTTGTTGDTCAAAESGSGGESISGQLGKNCNIVEVGKDGSASAPVSGDIEYGRSTPSVQAMDTGNSIDVKSAQRSALFPEEESSSDESAGAADSVVAAVASETGMENKDVLMGEKCISKASGLVQKGSIVEVAAASKSVFDLSDSDSDSNMGEVENGTDKKTSRTKCVPDDGNRNVADEESSAQKVAMVLADIEASARVSMAPFSSMKDSQSGSVEIAEQTPEDGKKSNSEEEKSDEPVYIPLSEMVRVEQSKNKVKKKRKKKTKVQGEEPVDRLAPFDYAAAAVQDEAEKRKTPEAEAFDVLASLKGDVPRAKRVKKSRKNPKSGSRSMTFMANK